MPYSGAFGRKTRQAVAGIAMRAALALLILLPAGAVPAASAFAASAAGANLSPAAAGGLPAERGNDAAIGAFRQAADALYASLLAGNRLEATRALNDLEASFRRLPMTEIASAEGISALAQSVAEMKRAMAAVSIDGNRLEQAAGALRLAADALENPGKPMWLQYRVVLKEDADELEKALEANAQGTSAETKRAFAVLQSRYGLIRTAAALRVEPYAIERADSVMRYAQKVLDADQPQPQLLGELAANVRAALDGLFPAASQRPASAVPLMPANWGFAATIGSFIVTILSWAGWRRYRYDRRHPPGGRTGGSG